MSSARDQTAVHLDGLSVLTNSVEDGGYDSPSSSASALDTASFARAAVVGLLMTTGVLTLTLGFLAVARLSS